MTAKRPVELDLVAIAEHLVAPLGADEVSRVVDLVVDAVGVATRGALEPLFPALTSALGQPANPADQAFRLGVACHVLDFDDTHTASLCHTGATVVSATLSCAAWARRPGTDALRGIAAGLRLVDHLAPLGPLLNAKGFHSTGLLGAIGSAAAAAVTLGHDTEQLVGAVELAATAASGLSVSFGTDGKPLQAGRASEAGVRAALLSPGVSTPRGATLGRRGVFALTLGPEVLDLLPEPGPRPDAITGVGVKPYPSCLLTHTPIDLALRLRSHAGVTVSQPPTTIQLALNPFVTTLADKTAAADLATSLGRKFSVRYCVLVALLLGESGVSAFEDDTWTRLLGGSPEPADAWPALLDRLTVTFSDDVPRLGARLEITSAAGDTAALEADAPSGSPSEPLGSEAIEAKFLDNVGAGRGEDEARRLLSELRSLPWAGSVNPVEL